MSLIHVISFLEIIGLTIIVGTIAGLVLSYVIFPSIENKNNKVDE